MSFPIKELIDVLTKPTSIFGIVISLTSSTIGIATKTGIVNFPISSANYPIRKGDRVVIRDGVVKLTRLVDKVVSL
jgi:hypothetical protein